MVVISSAELRGNMKKYLDIAKKEKVLIQRGKNETFVLMAHATNCDPLPKGNITDIDYGTRRIKVKLVDTLSPYGIIVFDGDITPDTDGSFERDFDSFTVNSPNRFYMQKGDEMWFDLNSHCWDSWWQLEQWFTFVWRINANWLIINQLAFYVVDYYDKLSNLLDAIRALTGFSILVNGSRK